MLQETYNMINNRLFDGELPDCTIYWLDEPELDFWPNSQIDGCYVREAGEHFIAIYIGLSTARYFNTMVHECIHVWQAHTGRKVNHGKSFKYWCQKAYEEFYESV